MAKDNTLNIITHILGYFTNWIGPLIILLVTKEKDVKEHAKKALNWQISLIIYYNKLYFSFCFNRFSATFCASNHEHCILYNSCC